MELKTENGYVVGYEDDGTSEINISYGTRGIGISAFRECQLLIDIDLPDTILDIVEFAFARSALRSIKIPDSVENIGKNAFCDCRYLTNVKLPRKLGNIANSTFSFCENLETIEIPESVTSIETFAFFMCSKLVVNIPDNFHGVVSEKAFAGCKEIRFKPYRIFQKFSLCEQLISVKTIIKNYYEDKAYYTEKELDDFRKFVLEHKELIWDELLRTLEIGFLELEEVFDYMLELDYDDSIKHIRVLLYEMSQAKQAEVASFLLAYLNDKLSLKNGANETNYLDELTLDDCNSDELENLNNSDNGEDKLKHGL